MHWKQCVRRVLTQNCLKRPQNLRKGPPGLLGGPPDATPSSAYLGTSPRPEPTTALFTLYYNAVLNGYKSTHLHLQK